MTAHESSHCPVLDRVSGGTSSFIAGLAVLAITLMITFDVLMRYFFNQPQLFVDELASFLLVGIIFLGLAQTFQKGGHIQVDLVTNRLGPNARRAFRIITLAVGIVFLGVVACETVVSSMIAYQQDRVSAVMIYPLWIPMLLIPIGVVFMMLVMMASLIHEWKTGQKKASEGPEEMHTESAD